MPKKKVRFVAVSKGEPRELFSVREGADGDLAINIRSAGGLSRDPVGADGSIGQILGLHEQRISVHDSREGKEAGTTIIQSMFTDGDEKESISAFIKQSRQNLLWHVYSFLCPDLSDDGFAPTARSTLEQIKLVDDIPINSTFIYHIFVLSVERGGCLFAPYAAYVRSFKKFKIVVYYCFLNVGHTNIGMGTSIPTSASRIDNQPIDKYRGWGEVFPHGSVSMKDTEMTSILNDLSSSLANGHVRFILANFPQAEESLRGRLMCFTSTPMPDGSPNIPIFKPPGPWDPTKLK